MYPLYKLTPDRIRSNWTDITGQKPFFWLNRVCLGSHFSRPLQEIPGAHVFRGELLPTELSQLFRGIQLHTGIKAEQNGTPYKNLPEGRYSAKAIAYLATAADYVWNPHDWDAVESYKRARRFAKIMMPLMQE